jgi:hypothetical protein
VAITGRFSDPLAADEVALPFHPGGQSNSGLRKPCVAKCSSLETLRLDQVVELLGFLRASTLHEILDRVGQVNP